MLGEAIKDADFSFEDLEICWSLMLLVFLSCASLKIKFGGQPLQDFGDSKTTGLSILV